MCDFELDYEPPVMPEIRKISQKISEDQDAQILATIQEECQIKINKFELMRALAYDRDQYRKGFEDAKKKFERPKGKWRQYEGNLTCLVCNAEFYDDIMEYTGDDVPKYCPNCGSDNRGELND